MLSTDKVVKLRLTVLALLYILPVVLVLGGNTYQTGIIRASQTPTADDQLSQAPSGSFRIVVVMWELTISFLPTGIHQLN